MFVVWSAKKCRITLAAATVSVACLVPAGTASAAIPTGLPTDGLPTVGLPTDGLPTTSTTILPTTSLPTTLLPTTSTTILPTTILPTTSTTILPTTSTTILPTTILPTTILPTTILPTTSLPTTSLPTTATVTTAPATTAPATTATTSIPPVQIPNPVTPADVVPPVAALAKKLAGAVKGGAFTFEFSGSEAGTWRALLYVVQGGAKASAKKKSVLIGSGKVTTAAAGKAAMKVRLNRKGKTLFRKRRKANAVLKLKGSDKAGNASSALTRKITLKKRR